MTRSEGTDTRLVYSTERGSTCPVCRKRLGRCSCVEPPLPAPADGIVRVGRSTKGRKGKGVTVVTGIPLDTVPLKELAKTLKQKCGSGGTVKSGMIEIQGDHRDALIAELENRGYTVRRLGG